MAAEVNKKFFDVYFYDSENGTIMKEVIFAVDIEECESLLIENVKPSHRGGEIVFCGADEANIIGWK
jgi:hypothetical protein